MSDPGGFGVDGDGEMLHLRYVAGNMLIKVLEQFSQAGLLAEQTEMRN